MIRKYLSYRKSWLCLIIILAGTITSIFLLDPFLSPTLSNVIYLNMLILFWTVLFCLFDFRRFRQHCLWLENIENAPPAALDPLLLIAIEQMRRVTSRKDQLIIKHNKDQQDFRDFINGWIHAVKTPLFASKMLLDGLPFDQPHQQLSKELENIEMYINQALFYARLETFSDDYRIELHEAHPILNRSLKQFRSSFILKKLSLQMQLSNISVLTDDKWLKFVFDQLISNAIKYATPASTVTIRDAKLENYYLVYITNLGEGIAESDLKRVFNRGFTGSNARKQNQSTGMGLYLAKSLCEKLGHAIMLESSNSETTATVRFKLPEDHHQISIFTDLTNS